MKVKLTAAQARVVAWALDPMFDFWCTESEAIGRDGPVYPETAIPKLTGRTLTLSSQVEINSDLLYRLEVQWSDIEPRRARSGIGAGAAIRKVDAKLADLPAGGGWI